MIPAKIEITAEGAMVALREYLERRGYTVVKIDLEAYDPAADTDSSLTVAEVTTDLSAERKDSPLQAATRAVVEAWRGLESNDTIPASLDDALSTLRDLLRGGAR